MDPDRYTNKRHKLGVISGVYIPVCLNILSILMFLRFGLILGQIGLLGMLGLLVISYLVDLVTTLSLSAVASNGEVKGGGAYYLISRSLGPEFGGSIGILFYLSQVLNTALNIVGLIDCLKLNFGSAMPHGYWWGYLFETVALLVCTALCLAGSGIFAKASNALLVVLTISILSIPLSALFVRPFENPGLGIEFTGFSLATLRSNMLPNSGQAGFRGLATFRDLFGILFPATSGIFAGASMSGDLQNPSRAIPTGTLWAMLSTLIAYFLVIFSLASSTTHNSLLRDANIIQNTNVWAPIIFAGECATTFFSALMGVIGSAKLIQALARDKLVPGLSVFGVGTSKSDEPLLAIFLTYIIAQFSLFANLNQIATFISMGYQMTFFVMNLACFLLKIGSAPNFRPAFKFFSWHTAFAGSVMSAGAMFFIDETYATSAVCLLIFLFLLIHYLSPPKHWGDVSQNLIYHQVRKYLLRLKPEHIKFWRPQIILLVGDPRRQTRLIQFCNSMKKGALYILGHVIVTDDFGSGVQEAKLQQSAWMKYITEFSRIKAFVQLSMSPSITWGVRNLILSAGLGGMRPNIAVIGFYNMGDLRRSQHSAKSPGIPISPEAFAVPVGKDGADRMVGSGNNKNNSQNNKNDGKVKQRRRGDTSARLLEGELPTDIIRTEEMMSVTSYLTILEDLALRHRLNVAVAKGFSQLEAPRRDGKNIKKYIDLWPIQMSAEVQADGRSVVTTNFDTYTLILQLGYILSTVPAWKRAFKLRVMVFVEYEREVKEERQRVTALLEKLRMDAEVHVFWLSSGELPMYEAVVRGQFQDSLVESLVNNALEGEWWEEVQRQRSSSDHPQESASGATGRHQHRMYDESSSSSGSRRRPSVSLLPEISKKPTVSILARMGFNMGIHTQHLNRSMFQIGSDEGSDSENESDSGSVADFNDVESAASEADLVDLQPSFRRPFPDAVARRKSHGDAIIQKRPASRKTTVADHEPLLMKAPLPQVRSQQRLSYGTMPRDPSQGVSRGLETPWFGSRPKISGRPPGGLGLGAPIASSGSGADRTTAAAITTSASFQRPLLSRAHSAAATLSGHLEPDKHDSASTLLITEKARPQRPGISRANSTNRFSSNVVPETRIIDVGGAVGPSITFAAPEPEQSLGGGTADVQIDIPELVATYRHHHSHPENEGGGFLATLGGGASPSSAAGATPAPAEVPLSLSFNDVPCRAQHLILNELMRQKSSDTAVLFTTLPIPEEGTCESEEASLQYLSDVEVLCHAMPPTLMVLSNNMTVTVSL